MNRFDLSDKKGLIIGVANEYSIAWACAKALKEQGAKIALTYLNDKAKPYVQPLADEVSAELLLPCDVSESSQLDALFQTIENEWGKLDFLIHSIAFAPLDDLHGRLVDSSREGFLQAMDISCHSLMRLCKKAEPLMRSGGSIYAMSYIGSERAIDNYNLMGPVKAALESSVRYLACELGESGVRTFAISPGPLATRAASGLKDFKELMTVAESQSVLPYTLTIDHVGSLVAFLVSDAAAGMTGNTFYVDCGYHLK